MKTHHSALAFFYFEGKEGNATHGFDGWGSRATPRRRYTSAMRRRWRKRSAASSWIEDGFRGRSRQPATQRPSINHIRFSAQTPAFKRNSLIEYKLTFLFSDMSKNIFLTVGKGQLISEWLLDVFISTKNRTKIFLYFCISALASKMGQIIKIMAHYHAN